MQQEEARTQQPMVYGNIELRLTQLEAWQVRQNGTLTKLDSSIIALQTKMETKLESTLTHLDTKISLLDATMDSKFDKWVYFFMAQLVAVILLAAGVWFGK